MEKLQAYFLAEIVPHVSHDVLYKILQATKLPEFRLMPTGRVIWPEVEKQMIRKLQLPVLQRREVTWVDKSDVGHSTLEGNLF